MGSIHGLPDSVNLPYDVLTSGRLGFGFAIVGACWNQRVQIVELVAPMPKIHKTHDDVEQGLAMFLRTSWNSWTPSLHVNEKHGVYC